MAPWAAAPPAQSPSRFQEPPQGIVTQPRFRGASFLKRPPTFPGHRVGSQLPLFPSSSFSPMLAHGSARTPGNTIRKVYLCRAKITRLRPGDLVLFYMSKDEAYAASQSITTVRVVEQVADVTSAEELIKRTAKRSVFSAEDLTAMEPSPLSPVKMIDFLLVGHSQPSVPLSVLTSSGILLNRPPTVDR